MINLSGQMDPGRGVKAERDIKKLDKIQVLDDNKLAVDAVSCLQKYLSILHLKVPYKKPTLMTHLGFLCLWV